jgi:hypothetical protein
LRHTIAVQHLSAGTQFMQVSQWLGHGRYTLTLDTYGGYIPEADGGAQNTLPEPPAPDTAARASKMVNHAEPWPHAARTSAGSTAAQRHK